VNQGERFGAFRFPLVVETREVTGVTWRATLDVPAERHARLTIPTTLASAPRSVTADPDVELLARIEVHPNR
jgi:hypothetical protein